MKEISDRKPDPRRNDCAVACRREAFRGRGHRKILQRHRRGAEQGPEGAWAEAGLWLSCPGGDGFEEPELQGTARLKPQTQYLPVVRRSDAAPSLMGYRLAT